MARRRGKKQTTNNNWHEQPQLADTELQLGGEEGAGAGAAGPEVKIIIIVQIIQM